MVKVKEDLTGKTFGMLTVLRQAEDYITPQGIHISQWLCECRCSEHNKKIVRGVHLKSGHTQSCGCLQYNNNKYNLSGEYGVLWETNTNKEVYFDLCNAQKILKYSWFEANTGYPSANIDGQCIPMHIFLGYKWHDHKNRNKKDNRAENFRPCSRQENNRNKSKTKGKTSEYIGVCKDRKRNLWIAHITIDYATKNLGRYRTEEEALIVRLRAEKEYFGEFAPQKDLFEQYEI